ncbi:MAG: hypothetical protein GC146_15265 [Limimaricola sp.]|uniref:hypothetical protein n=1 Tax=Limimaricola sp. TaxID=2211665 RepID=UPI001DE1C345|nr:hypothetical protein [Limimaricola sp.]MBI1418574.1 hypothetical protein [Limimaricola sp.]
MGEPVILTVLPVGSGVVGAALGYGLGRTGRAWAVWGPVGLMLACVGWLWFLARATHGWDGLGYFIAALFIVLPAAVGLAIGGLIGRHHAKTRANAKPPNAP